MSYTPGPGDMLGQYTGHPHDPRTPDDDSDDTTVAACDEAIAYICAALVEYRKMNFTAHEQILRKAVMEINGMLGESK